jgi:hypothetical protein
LQLNGFIFIGASGVPSDPTGFMINVNNGTAFFKWDKALDIDYSYSQVRFSGIFSGATWGTSQILEDKIYDNRFEVPFIPGTYLIKHFDLTGNESETATAIITYDPGTIENAVAIVDDFNDSPQLAGELENTKILNNTIVLGDTSLIDGYYYMTGTVNLTGVYPAFVSATIVANGTFINNIFDVDDVFAMDDFFGIGGNNIFDVDDVFAMDDFFGIGDEAWEVQLEYSTTQTDPSNSPVEWSDWAPLNAGTFEFYEIKFRIKLTSLQQYVSPQVTQLSVRVDMSDRIERGEDLTCDAIVGDTIIFNPEFKVPPAVAITIQDGDVDDRVEYMTKTSGEFSFKVYNKTAAAYVTRSYDYIASGYGRKNIS